LRVQEKAVLTAFLLHTKLQQFLVQCALDVWQYDHINPRFYSKSCIQRSSANHTL